MNGRERLAVLADALEVNAANPTGMKFDLGSWIDHPQPLDAALDCGTVGCAAGLACLLPELQAEGLSLNNGSWGAVAPYYNGGSGWVAVQDFFEVDDKRGYDLFDADSYKDGPTKGAEAELRVAKRIREYLAATA